MELNEPTWKKRDTQCYLLFRRSENLGLDSPSGKRGPLRAPQSSVARQQWSQMMPSKKDLKMPRALQICSLTAILLNACVEDRHSAEHTRDTVPSGGRWVFQAQSELTVE